MQIVLWTMALILLIANCGDSSGGSRANPDIDSIPADPGGAPPELKLNNLIPQVAVSGSNENDTGRIRLSLGGLIDPTTNEVIPLTPNSTIYVQEDGILKGFIVKETEKGEDLPIDLVLTMDTSGSMDSEADTLAAKISDFSTLLTNAGIDVRIGIVGYHGQILGAADLGSSTDVISYLYRRESRGERVLQPTGVERYSAFWGKDAGRLEEEAKTLNQIVDLEDENGVTAIYFASKLFNFRTGALRSFVNFTDEANHSHKNPTEKEKWHDIQDWSVAALCKDWKETDGIIYTVWSGSTDDKNQPILYPLDHLKAENPALASDCSGGRLQIVEGDASNLDLVTMDISTKLANSAWIEFRSSDISSTHELVITIVNKDDQGNVTADGKLVLSNVSY